MGFRDRHTSTKDGHLPVYGAHPSPHRLSSSETTDEIDLTALRSLADGLADVPAPLRVVAPRELDPCSACPEDPDHLPLDAVADVVYGPWREPVCSVHALPVVRWHLRYRRDVHVEVPAPVLAALTAVA